MQITRVYATPDGVSHFEDTDVPLTKGGVIGGAARELSMGSAAVPSSFLLQKGEVCRSLALVAEGCLRLYSIDAGGKEHIVQFAFDGWWISDLYSFLTTEPSPLTRPFPRT